MTGRDNSFAVQPCDISSKIEGSSQRKMRVSEKLTVFIAESSITGVEDLDAFLRPHRKQDVVLIEGGADDLRRSRAARHRRRSQNSIFSSVPRPSL